MIKLLDILEEGALLLTPDERNQIEKMIPKIIDIISGPTIKENEYKEIGWIDYQFADKTPGAVFVYIGNDDPKATAYFNTNDPNNPTDNSIVIQQKYFASYFANLGGLVSKTQKFIAGDENTGIELLRQSLKHELIHAKDPARNHHFLKEPYDPNKKEVYYKSWAEFQTMTGQFLESIVAGVDRVLKNDLSENNIKKIQIALSNILDFFAGKTIKFNQEAIDFIQNTQSRNIFQKIIKKIEQVIDKDPVGTGALGIYALYIAAIKRYHPEAYNEFLKDLYKVIDEAKDKVNNALEVARQKRTNYIKQRAYQIDSGEEDMPASIPSNIKLREMQYINEAKRFQKLAGIINEEINNSADEKAFDAELMAAANAIAGAIGKELKFKDPKQLDESLIFGTIAAIMTGNAVVGFISKYSAKLFKLLKWHKGEDIAEQIYHWAHDNEMAFQSPIKRVLGFFIKDTKTLDMVTKAIYAIVVGSMAAGYGAQAVNKLSHAEWFKGALTSLKTLAKGDEAIVNAYPAIKAFLT